MATLKQMEKKTVNSIDAIASDAKAMIQDMHRMSAEAKAKGNKEPPVEAQKFAEVLKEALSQVEHAQAAPKALTRVNELPQVAVNLNHGVAESTKTTMALRVLEDAIQAYHEIENMQL